MNSTIADAALHDAPALVHLRTRVAHDMTEKFGAGPWSAFPSKTDVLRQLRASHVLVARRDEVVIGTVRLARVVPGIIDSDAFTPVETALYVFGLAVAPEARGQGIGRELMKAAKAAARSWPADALWLDAYDHAAGAGAFYLKCGFRAVGPSGRGEVPLHLYKWLARPAPV